MSTVDMLIHIRTELDAQGRAELEKRLRGHAGVSGAEFRGEAHPHSLVVSYDPGTVERMEILKEVRLTDPEATTLGC